MSRISKAWRNTRFYRRRAAKWLPHALILGAQKAGTSALFAYLGQHPRLAPSREKEVSFFGSDLRYALGLEWYATQWHHRTPADALRFEASPLYLFAKQAPGRILACVPKAKLIVMFRDPIERAYSAWRMYRRQLADDPLFYHNLYRTRFTPEEVALFEERTASEFDDFWLAVQREAESLERGRSRRCSVLELGVYAPQLQRYFDVFPREQLLVLDSEDLRTRRVETLNRVLDFLGLPPWDWSQANLADVFVGNSSAPIPPRARDFLREFYREPNRRLAAMLDEPPQFARGDVWHLASA